MRWASENVWCSDLETETHVGKRGGNHDDPHDFDRRHWEDREATLILECETNEQNTCLRDVLSEQMENELLDIVEHAATLLDSVQDRGKVVIGQNNVGSVLGNIGSSSHTDTNI